jgi:hypothetical protein
MGESKIGAGTLIQPPLRKKSFLSEGGEIQRPERPFTPLRKNENSIIERI